MRANAEQGSFFHKLGEAVENPHSGFAGKVFAFMSVMMVVVTVVSLCISTMPDQQQQESMVCTNQSNGVHDHVFFNSKYEMRVCTVAQFMINKGHFEL